MSMTDPIADMLTRLRNAAMARQERTHIPASRLKGAICEVLQEEGFIRGYRLVDVIAGDETKNKRSKGTAGQFLQVDLKWKDNRCAVEGIRRISRPGRRYYASYGQIDKVRGGQGIKIITTSKGLMSDRKARKCSIGGEVLCEVW